MVAFGQGGCTPANCLFLGKYVCIWAKVIVFGQGGSFRAMWLYSAKLVVFGQNWLYLGNVVLLGKVVVFGQKWLYSGIVVLFG